MYKILCIKCKKWSEPYNYLMPKNWVDLTLNSNKLIRIKDHGTRQLSGKICPDCLESMKIQIDQSTDSEIEDWFNKVVDIIVERVTDEINA